MTDPVHAPLLSVSDLTMRFGGIVALNDVSFEVERHSISALIGPNGAGKTTVFNCLTGFYKATEGAITLRTEREEINLVRELGEGFRAGDFVNPAAFGERLYYKMFGGSHRVARAGVARTFQNVRLFREMTAMENLLVAQHMQLNRNLLSGVFNTQTYRQSERNAVERAYAWLKVFSLEKDANRLAGELPYGHQRRLEIARAMCTGPRLLCLDEPAAGLNPRETYELSLLIRQLRDDHQVTVLLIEHHMGLVMDLSDYVVVLDYGEVIAAGEPQAVAHDPAVITAYLGAADEDEEAAP
ncbi:MAG: ATP-binding cassette domain-containing protein [Gammaproteobacteria bacterium]|nr:ATP-binding cassette domain-containing protein [Gammaproteobacteria bacterium]MCP5425036.1 ATP-binding cassette domain-containing protein [Gammaproteobacteria bacterium]MCP5459739.1 ATP-binding cassette domain-containing protein [Gammaproteobacteria bacterium]